MKITKRQLKKLVQEELSHVLNEQDQMTDPDAPETKMATGQLAAISASRGLKNVVGDLEYLVGKISRAIQSQNMMAMFGLANDLRDSANDLYNIVSAARSEQAGDEYTTQAGRGYQGGRVMKTRNVKYLSGGRPSPYGTSGPPKAPPGTYDR